MSNKPFPWKPEYDLGIEDIDFQHHYFLNLINRLTEELKSTKDASSRAPLIAELNAYARFHFISEENLMHKAGYPDLETHRRHHLDLLRELNNREGLLKLENNDRRVNEIIGFLVHWFAEHTTGEDRRFAEYFHQCDG